MTQPNRSVSERGFTGYDEFADTYGNQIRVQQSSSAEGPRVWIFANHDRLQWLRRDELARLGSFDLDILASKLTPSPHLDVEQAKRLCNALNAFIAEHSD